MLAYISLTMAATSCIIHLMSLGDSSCISKANTMQRLTSLVLVTLTQQFSPFLCIPSLHCFMAPPGIEFFGNRHLLWANKASLAKLSVFITCNETVQPCFLSRVFSYLSHWYMLSRADGKVCKHKRMKRNTKLYIVRESRVGFFFCILQSIGLINLQAGTDRVWYHHNMWMWRSRNI